jgi:hypothetical protein
MNETGTIRCQEYNSLGILVCYSRTACWSLGGQLLKAFAHCVRAFSPRRSRTHCIDADAARATAAAQLQGKTNIGPKMTPEGTCKFFAVRPGTLLGYLHHKSICR